MSTLRPYQQQAVAGIHEAWQAHDSTLLVMPTGTGKTIVLSNVIAQQDGGRAMVIAHREELIFQAAEKIAAVTRQSAGIEMADEHAQPGDRLVVATTQSIARRLEKWPRDYFHLVIVDEAHTCARDPDARGNRHQRFELLAGLAEDPERHLVLVTATPHSGNLGSPIITASAVPPRKIARLIHPISFTYRFHSCAF
jgi:superfamily II DNA or RNA helicase